MKSGNDITGFACPSILIKKPRRPRKVISLLFKFTTVDIYSNSSKFPSTGSITFPSGAPKVRAESGQSEERWLVSALIFPSSRRFFRSCGVSEPKEVAELLHAITNGDIAFSFFD